MGRRLGQKDSRPRQPRGSESSRILARRLATALALAGDTSPLRSAHALDEFERDQVARLRRLFDRSIDRVQTARRQLRRADERATRREVVTEWEVEIRGSCGSDVHMGSGD